MSSRPSVYTLGIDVGTTYTAAAVWQDGRADVVHLGDRAASIPSVLFLDPDTGMFLVGDAARRRAVGDPSRIAREFKRRMGDHVEIRVGDKGFSPAVLCGQLIRWVVNRVSDEHGVEPDHVTLTCPASWRDHRRALMTEAAAAAGLSAVGLLDDPVAACIHYSAQERVDAGDVIAVYDLGGGTFDAAVLRKTVAGFEILGAPDGSDALGGCDFDDRVMAHVIESLGGRWGALDRSDPAVLGAMSQVRNAAVDAKEALSSDVLATVPVVLPGVTTEVRLTRTEFEQSVQEQLAESVALLGQTVKKAGLAPADLRGVLLVGGSSRIPLVTELIYSSLGVSRVAVDAHPKHAICLGGAIAAAARLDDPGTGTGAEPTDARPLSPATPVRPTPTPVRPTRTPVRPTPAPVRPAVEPLPAAKQALSGPPAVVAAPLALGLTTAQDEQLRPRARPSLLAGDRNEPLVVAIGRDSEHRGAVGRPLLAVALLVVLATAIVLAVALR